jgi:hypothetical protein
MSAPVLTFTAQTNTLPGPRVPLSATEREMVDQYRRLDEKAQTAIRGIVAYLANLPRGGAR